MGRRRHAVPNLEHERGGGGYSIAAPKMPHRDKQTTVSNIRHKLSTRSIRPVGSCAVRYSSAGCVDTWAYCSPLVPPTLAAWYLHPSVSTRLLLSLAITWLCRPSPSPWPRFSRCVGRLLTSTHPILLDIPHLPLSLTTRWMIHVFS